MSQKRRTFSPEFKFEAVMELLRGHKPVTDICRERQINDNLLYKWRDAFLKRGSSVFETAPGKASLDDSSARIAELERMVGRLAVENDILKKADSLLGELRRKRGT